MTNGPAVDLLITDLRMPNMQGDQLEQHGLAPAGYETHEAPDAETALELLMARPATVDPVAEWLDSSSRKSSPQI